MQLTFEYNLDAGAGLFPQVIHTSDNLLRFIYLTSDGTVEGATADPVLGLYGNLTYEEISRISPDETVSYPSIKRVAHYGAYGFWSAEGDHRFVMYMLPADISNSFVDGSIKYGVGSEVSQMSCTLSNIKGAMLNRYRALVTPGTKMELYFSLGNSGEIPLGIFYIDRASVSYPEEKVSVSARNAIGKLLKEQTVGKNGAVTYKNNTMSEYVITTKTIEGASAGILGSSGLSRAVCIIVFVICVILLLTGGAVIYTLNKKKKRIVSVPVFEPAPKEATPESPFEKSPK